MYTFFLQILSTINILDLMFLSHVVSTIFVSDPPELFLLYFYLALND